ncbi:hypothetical protein AM586_28225 [Massilia sp. WG5]|nr:hypothetical protein AM586_28225 [Massilia sp. WG5]
MCVAPSASLNLLSNRAKQSTFITDVATNKRRSAFGQAIFLASYNRLHLVFDKIQTQKSDQTRGRKSDHDNKSRDAKFQTFSIQECWHLVRQI